MTGIFSRVVRMKTIPSRWPPWPPGRPPGWRPMDRARCCRDGAQRGDVLQRHLRWPVLADAHARVRAGEHHVGAADRRHAHEVVGARQERGEGGGEWAPAAHLEADRVWPPSAARRCRHWMKRSGCACRELLGVGRVADLAVERHHVAARRCRAPPARRRTPCASPPCCRPRMPAGAAGRWPGTCAARRCPSGLGPPR